MPAERLLPSIGLALRPMSAPRSTRELAQLVLLSAQGDDVRRGQRFLARRHVRLRRLRHLKHASRRFRTSMVPWMVPQVPHASAAKRRAPSVSAYAATGCAPSVSIAGAGLEPA